MPHVIETSDDPGRYDLIRIPEDQRQEVFEALCAWKTSSLSVRKILSGKSGAIVALVDVKMPVYSGVAVLKFGNLSKMANEINNHRIAHNIKYIQACMPEFFAHHDDGKFCAVLMSVAGWSLLEVDPLADLAGGRQSLCCQIVSEKLLKDLNKDVSFDSNPSAPKQVLEKWISRQIGPESRIPDFLIESTTLNPDADFFRYLGTDFPNPFCLSNYDHPSMNFSVTVGNVHGDLHQGNVLFSRYSQNRVYFIDFDTFKTDAPIFFDHAYLELSLLLTAREDSTPQRWKRICDELAEISKPQDALNSNSEDDVGLFRMCGMLRDPLDIWIKTHSARTEYLKKQLYIARIAAGLNFCNKKSLHDEGATSNKKKLFAFLYAAFHAKLLFEYCKIEIPVDAPPLVFGAERPLPKVETWRSAWDCCRQFDEGKGTFILLCGDELEAEGVFTRSMLGRLPWSLIVDHSLKGVLSAFSVEGLRELRRRRAVFHAYPHQILASDQSAGATWIATEIESGETAAKVASLAAWKARTLPPVRNLAARIYRDSTPKSVVVVIFDCKADPAKIRGVFSSIQESITEYLDVVLISNSNSSEVEKIVREEAARFTKVDCSIEDFMLGVYQMVGDASDEDSVWIPVRNDLGEIKLQPLTAVERALYAAAIDIAPASFSKIKYADDGDTLNFLKGKPISWQALEAHADVDRDATKKIVAALRRRLLASPNESFAIEHSPGAGGSTIAKRVAWELRDEFPGAVVSLYGPALIDTLEALFRQTNLPLLIIVEAGHVPVSQRDLLFSELKSRNVRFLILDVRRRLSPRESEHSVAIVDPMPLSEARRFLGIYLARAPESRRALVLKLASDRPEDVGHSHYRSAFFFGLYSFERDFVKVESFIDGSLSETTESIRRYICILALITRYSQERIPVPALNLLLGLDPIASKVEFESTLGRGPTRLLFYDGQTASIKHPLLAETILRRVLQPVGNDNSDAWRGPLNDFCISVIEEIAAKGLAINDHVLDILYDLFLERQSSQGSNKSRFSELMEEFKSEQGERRVFEVLCNEFPTNSHFLSHFARNINYRKTGTFEEAVLYAERAIAFDSNDDDHHHILGMIYRFEIERNIELVDRHTLDLAELIRSIDPLFNKAAAAFNTARELRGDSEFPLVSPIQMTLYTLESLFSLANMPDFISFLARSDSIGAWCRAKLDYAEDLIDALHKLEANGQPSERRIRCDADLSKLKGDFSVLIGRLRELLKRSDVAKGPVRRLIVSSYLDRFRRSMRDDVNVFREVASLAEANLNENPGSVLDLRSWLRAYRVLPNFSISNAIDKVTRTSMVSDDIEPIYYLMILSFMSGRLGFPNGHVEAKKYAEICKRKSANSIAQKSFEWLANSAMKRPMPLVHHSEIGAWSKETDFFEGIQKLGRAEGRIDDIKSPQAGTILMDGMPAFFVPRNEFRRVNDTNRRVTAFIGFSYQGLRAWNVKPVD